MAKHKERQGFLFYDQDLDSMLQFLSMEERGMLLIALHATSRGEEVDSTPFSPQLGMAYHVMKIKIDRDAQRYAETCQRNSTAAQKRHKQSHKDDENLRADASAENVLPNLPTETKTVTETVTETETETVKETESVYVRSKPTP